MRCRSRRLSRRALVRAMILVVVLGAAVFVALIDGVPERVQIKGWMDGAGSLAPAAFVALYAVTTLFPVPKNVLSVLAGLMFGMAWGLILVWGAAMLGAVVAFALGRALGREAVEALTGARVARVDEVLARHGLLSIIGVRLVPVLPFTVINYSAGLTAVPFSAYLLGTAVGIVPGTVAFVALGAYSTDLGSWPIIAAVTALILLTVGGVVAARRWRSPTKDPTPPSS